MTASLPAETRLRTPQEIIDHFGYLVIACDRKLKVGEVLDGFAIESEWLESKTVVVATSSENEAGEHNLFMGMSPAASARDLANKWLSRHRHFYRVIAE